MAVGIAGARELAVRVRVARVRLEHVRPEHPVSVVARARDGVGEERGVPGGAGWTGTGRVRKTSADWCHTQSSV